MILEFALLGNLAFCANEKPSEWTIETETVKVVSYDSKCVQVKDKSGKKISLKRSGFKDMKMISGVTEVQIHPDSLGKSLCSK
ncbi:MAG TPA: hypothetical protein VN132_08520 [Bdellovibrio sp.]|nr:hypothetical protein [Bdellovibrio sp.]